MSQTSEINSTNGEINTDESNNNSKIKRPWMQTLLSQGADLETKYVTYQKYASKVEVVDNAIGILNAPNIDMSQRIANFIDHSKANNTILPNDCMLKQCGERLDRIVNVTSKMDPEAAEKFRCNMLQGLDDVKCKMADDFLYTSAMVSLGLVLVQIWQLIDVWEEIKKAQNLHNDRTKFLEIEQNIAEFKEICIRMNESIDNVQVDDVVIDTVELSEKYAETLSLISDLKVQINGVMQRLDLIGKGQKYNGVSNSILIGSNIVQLIKLFDSSKFSAKLITSATIALSSCLLVANVTTYFLTQKRIEELRTDIQQLKQYELEFKKIYSDIKKVLKARRRRN